KDDESQILHRKAVLAIIESYDVLAAKVDDITAQVARLAGLPEPESISVTDESVEGIAAEDLNRVSLEGLSSESILYLLQRGQQVGASPLTRRAASMLLSKLDESSDPQLALIAHTALMGKAATPAEMQKHLADARAHATKHELKVPNLLFTDMQIQLRLGNAEGFQATVNQIVEQHGNEPEIMAQLQQQLVALGLIRPDGSPRNAGASPAGQPAAPAASGGLWTPDSPAPAATPSAGSPAGEGGGGKLWVPGMD
ncbi:MAG: protein-disulfide isomerase, partial [Pseudomonadota bacterium]